MSSKLLKSNYSIHHKIESFFTGTQIQFDQDGTHIYCPFGSTINKVCVDDGQVKGQIPASDEEDTVIQFTLTPDNCLIIIAYHSGLIRKVKLENLETEREFRSIHNAPIAHLRSNQDSSLLATGSSDGTIKLWNLVNHYCTHNLKGVNGVISCIEFYNEAEDGGRSLLFCAAGDDCIHIFDLASSIKITKLSSHCSTITSLGFSHDTNYLISTGRDKIGVVWDISKGAEKYGAVKRTIPLFESVESMIVLSKQQAESLANLGDFETKTIFATVGEEKSIKFWDFKAGAKIFSQGLPPLSSETGPSSECFQLISRPKHNQLCVASYDRNIFFYEFPKLELTQQLQGHIDEVFSACWFGKKNSHLAVATNSQDLKIIELSTSKCQHLAGHSDIVLCVKSVPTDPYKIISSAKDCVVLVWNFEKDTMRPTILFRGSGHTHAIHSLAVLFSKKVFFSGSEDSTIKSWTFETARIIKRGYLEEPDTLGTKSMISNLTIKAHDERVDALAISPNDELIASGSKDKTAKIFTVDKLQQVAVLKGHRRGIFAVQFSPVDQVIVTSSGDSTLKMWNLQDFTCIKTFQGHDCSVINFTFISEGLQILSVGSDGNMKLWNCKSTECSKTIDAHDGNIWSLCSTKDDNFVVTAAQDGKLIVWKDCTEDERERRIENLQAQVLQEQEFVNFVNKKVWEKAFEIAISLENQTKTLNVVREILLEPNGSEQLKEIVSRLDRVKVNFLIECCIQWASYTKNSAIAQTVFNIIIKSKPNSELLRLPGLTNTLAELKQLTEKSYNRYEKLVQEATFVDFFLNSFKIQ